MTLDLGMDPNTEKYNSALYWLPRITDAGLPVPRTETIEIDPDLVWLSLGAWEDDTGDKKEAIKSASAQHQIILGAARSFGFPVFIRTDKGSAKHEGPESYRADTEEEVARVVARTINHEMEHDLVGERFPAAILVREWLHLNSAFTAFGGTRIAREFRFFVEGERLWCSHFYWPEDAVRFEPADNPPEDWRERLDGLRKIETLSDTHLPAWNAWNMALLAGRACPDHPKWSVDFAEDMNGKWWLIDMAIAERSWHPKDCPNHEEIKTPRVGNF